MEGWPLIAAPGTFVDGLTPADRQLVEQGMNIDMVTNNKIIMTTMALSLMKPFKLDLLIRADGGHGLPHLPERMLMEPNTLAPRSLLVIDFNDEHHPELQELSDARSKAYQRQGWYAAGVDPVHARVQQFMASRPKG